MSKLSNRQRGSIISVELAKRIDQEIFLRGLSLQSYAVHIGMARSTLGTLVNRTAPVCKINILKVCQDLRLPIPEDCRHEPDAPLRESAGL
jgi:hypothetical protein